MYLSFCAFLGKMQYNIVAWRQLIRLRKPFFMFQFLCISWKDSDLNFSYILYILRKRYFHNIKRYYIEQSSNAIICVFKIRYFYQKAINVQVDSLNQWSQNLQLDDRINGIVVYPKKSNYFEYMNVEIYIARVYNIIKLISLSDEYVAKLKGIIICDKFTFRFAYQKIA